MRAFHDTRNPDYRVPYGAVAINTPVTLALDVWDAPGATATLRIWIDGIGEILHDMTCAGTASAGEAQRFEVTLSPDQECIYWYQFIITDADGNSCRYGALDGKTGGEGRLLGWEPPSFQLSVFDPDTLMESKALNGLCYVAPNGFFDDTVIEAQDGGTVDGQDDAADDATARRECPIEGRDATKSGEHAEAGSAAVRITANEKLDYLKDLGVSCVLLERSKDGAAELDDGRLCPLQQAALDRGIEIVALDERIESRLTTMRPIMDALVSFTRGETTAQDLVELFESTREATPAKFFDDALPMLSAPGQTRLVNLLGNAPAAEEMTPQQRSEYHVDGGQRGLAKGRMWCACLVQMFLGNTPAVRYGDEAGMEGYAQACADGEFPWGSADGDCQDIIRNAHELQQLMDALPRDSVEVFAPHEDVAGIWKRGKTGEATCVLVNRSISSEHDVFVPMVADHVSEVIAGYGLPVFDEQEARAQGCDVDSIARRFPEAKRFARMHLHQFGSAVLLFHGKQRLELPMESGVGILAHITSIPTSEPERKKSSRTTGASAKQSSVSAPGTLGAPARAFVDWLAEAGVRYWQVLPVNPTDEHGSPYAGISAFAGNVRLLEGGEPKGAPKAADLKSAEFKSFCKREGAWLEPYACFMAIRQKQGAKKTWQQWPKKWRTYNPELVSADAKLAEFAQAWRYRQFLFEKQWEELRSYANERDVKIIGDMPIYVSADSADVWAHPEIFQLGEDGRPSMVAGCPPDAFAADGQIWGNPVYDWDALKASGYDWWLRRLERAFELYDVVRLDHFIGFARYYSIPKGQKATTGTFRPGPGIDFFRTAHERFGALPLIAEDLGYITPVVRALCAACGFPGMDIEQFVDGGDPLGGYWPRPGKIAYTGTHDNQTIVGYAQSRYNWLDAHETGMKLMEGVASSTADVCVFPLQDVMLLDDDARMNTPSTTEGNWMWQARTADMADALERARTLVKLHESTR